MEEKVKLKLIEKVSDVTQLEGTIVDSLESNEPTKNATSIRVVKEIKDNLDTVGGRVDRIETQGVAVGDTLPIGSVFYFEGDESEIPTGFGKIETPVPPKQLLINNDFQINQRGQTVYDFFNKNAYTLDMWSVNMLKVSILEDGWIKVENTDTNDHSFQQKFGFTRNGTYTVCAEYRNVSNGTHIWYQDEKGISTTVKQVTNGRNVATFNSNEFTNIATACPAGGSFEIKYIDLFEDDIAYPHVKEDYAIALMRCLPYFEKRKKVVTSTSNWFIGGFDFDFPKKSIPVVVIFSIRNTDDGYIQGTKYATQITIYGVPYIGLGEGTSAGSKGTKTWEVEYQATCEPL